MYKLYIFLSRPSNFFYDIKHNDEFEATWLRTNQTVAIKIATRQRYRVATMARREGFEPSEAHHLARLPNVCLRPLDHLRLFNNLFNSMILPNIK